MMTRLLLAATVAVSLAASALGAEDYTAHPVVAISNAQVILEPGKILDNATVVVRNGIIEAVGVDLPIPFDALVIDATGMIVHAGFMDCGSSRGYDESLRRSYSGPPQARDVAENAYATLAQDDRRLMTPEFQVSHALKFDATEEEKWRLAGVSARLIWPKGGILSGQSAFITLGGMSVRERLLTAAVASHLEFQTNSEAYPITLMGMFAHLRQTLRDAEFQRRTQNEAVGQPASGDPALTALDPVLSSQLPLAVVANTEDEIYRVLQLADEFRFRPIIAGGSQAWKVAKQLKERDIPVLFDLNFPEEPKIQPDSKGKDDKTDPDVPLKVRVDRHQKWVERLQCPQKLLAEGVKVALRCEGIDAEKLNERLRTLKEKGGLSDDNLLAMLTVNPATIVGMAERLGSVTPGNMAHLVIRSEHPFDEKTWVRQILIQQYLFDYRPVENMEKEEEDKEEDKQDDGKENEAPSKPSEPAESVEKPASAPPLEIASETDADRKPKHRTGGSVLIRGATLLTVSDAGNLDEDLLVVDGRIDDIGPDLVVDSETFTIEADGLYVMPGIIDTHSHMAIAGGINESSLSITPEVRIKDVVDSTDVSIYRALAGGVTVARLLHGSANTIGGQDAVIKLRYLQPARDLIVESADQGVKFALGENVTRRQGRFPSTRMGVEATMVRAFAEAQQYQRQWTEYRENVRRAGQQPPPRRDLRLEALSNILSGKWHVHCHCYRADEILMLLRVADRFNFKIRSLQHALEAYKIAPEIARHGASISTFSDWWAYKWEAYDATPYNTKLLRQAGIEVCLKSDSNELIRHMYQEAAKMLRYGRMTEQQALETITIIPARQLGLGNRIGSLEVGKDADLAVFHGHPLNTYSRCVLTVVDGEIYFEEPGFFRRRGNKLSPATSPLEDPVDRSLLLTQAEAPKLPEGPVDELAITGATVFPVDGPPIDRCTVFVRDGRIAEIGTELNIPEGTPVIDATGLRLYPGLVDAGTKVGLSEVKSARETLDFAEEGFFQPDLRASSAIHPDSELIPVTRAGGVTSVVAMPSGGIISGQSVMVNLAGWVPDEMLVKDPLALHLHLPSVPSAKEKPARPFSGRGRLASLRQRQMNDLRALFRAAQLYKKTREEAGRRNRTAPVTDPRLDAVCNYLGPDALPVVFHADSLKDIRQVLEFSQELQVRPILSGGRDAWKLANEIKDRDIPVIVGPVMTRLSEEYDPYDSVFRNCARLYEAGIRFCIQSDNAANARNLPFEAAMAVAFGLPPEEGLKAVTLYPSQILGVDDDLGSIREGKLANLILTDGDPLQASTQILAVIIKGQPFKPESKHTRLYERYLQRLQQPEAISDPPVFEKPAEATPLKTNGQ